MLRNYVKTAFKVFLRRKFFTFISLFAISFTLTVLMVATAFFDHIFSPFPPEVKADRTLGVFTMRREGPKATETGAPGYVFLDRYVRTLPDVERVSLFTDHQTAISYKNGVKIESDLKHTDGEFWKIREFNFLEGNPFTSQDEKEANFVAVINEATRKKFFDDQPAVGKTLEVDGQRFRVVGVVDNVPIFRIVPFADIWVPISTMKSNTYQNEELMGRFLALVLARNRSDFGRIKEEFRSRLSQVELPRKYNKLFVGMDTFFESASRMVFSSNLSESHPGYLLAAILSFMILFMLLPTVNLININLSRMLERASEIGVRKAFGASSRTLIGQFVVENILLTLIGGLIGFIGSFLVLQAITHSGLIQYAQFHTNYRIFLYGLLIAVFFGVFSGVYPAYRMSRLHPVEALRRRP